MRAPVSVRQVVASRTREGEEWRGGIPLPSRLAEIDFVKSER